MTLGSLTALGRQARTVRNPIPPVLVADYRRVRAATEALCEGLAIEDFVVQSMPDASPVKWHLAHTSWFFEEFVLRAFAGDTACIEPQFRYLFNSYYQSVGPMQSRAERGVLSRPTVAETFAYRARVDQRMETLLASLEKADEPRRAAVTHVTTLGLHHEQQHQELLLTDIKHAFAANVLQPIFRARKPDEASVRVGGSTPLRFVSFPGGITRIGHGGEGFCFDNELPCHTVLLQPFLLADRAVTNSEFREFMRAGGYREPRHWLSDGWAFVQAERRGRPIYWAEALDAEFTLAGMQPLDAASPVCHLSYYEADAFARWAGARLPTEFEWEATAAEIDGRGNFVESGALHPRPAPRDAGIGLSQMFGDVWEWTMSPYSAYPGYRPAEGALGEYNGKFMVNQLVLRGGSCATPRSHIRPTYRNFFPPTARWQFSGLRLAKDA